MKCSVSVFLLLFLSLICLSSVFLFPKIEPKHPAAIVAENFTAKEKPIAIHVDYTSYDMAINHLLHFEPFSPDIYVENNRNYIGHGHLIKSNESFLQPISSDIGLELLKKDFHANVKFVSKRYNLFGNQALALGLMAFNRGVGNTCSGCIDSLLMFKRKFPHVLLNQNWRDALFACWASFDSFMGNPHRLLILRREFEIALFFSDNLLQTHNDYEQENSYN